MPLWLFPQIFGKVSEIFDSTIDLIGFKEQNLSFDCWLKAAFYSIKEFKSKARLRVTENLACRRLGNTKEFCCPADRTSLTDSVKDFDVAQTHVIDLSHVACEHNLRLY